MTDEQIEEYKYILWKLYDERDFGSPCLYKWALRDGLITRDEFNQLCGDYVLEAM